MFLQIQHLLEEKKPKTTNLSWIGNDLPWKKKQKQELASSMLVDNKIPFLKGQVCFVVKSKSKKVN